MRWSLQQVSHRIKVHPGLWPGDLNIFCVCVCVCFLRGKIAGETPANVSPGRERGNSMSREEAGSVPAPILLRLLEQVAGVPPGLQAPGASQCSCSVLVVTQ